MSQTTYDSEDLFQRLLADHPTLLGDIAGASRKLWLVQREAPVPEALDGGGRWSLDHLFLDQEGVPILVEVKRASDTRSRREVVAQMLDYAANGVAYWPIEQIADAALSSTDEESQEAFSQFLDGRDPEVYWRQVEANLRSGRIRMVFVADQIQKELRRIIEFLNEQMRPAEVLAVEVEHFMTPGGLRLLTPRVIGQTERASTTKTISASQAPALNLADWLETLRDRHGVQIDGSARVLIAWMTAAGLSPVVKRSNDAVAFQVSLPNGKIVLPFFIRRSSGKVEVSLANLASLPPFADDASRKDVLARLGALPGVPLSTNHAAGWPNVPLTDLARADVFEAWTAIASDILTKLKE